MGCARWNVVNTPLPSPAASDCVWYSSRWIFWRLLESFPLIGEEGCEVFHFLWLSRRGFIWVRSAYCGYLNMDMGVIRVCIGT